MRNGRYSAIRRQQTATMPTVPAGTVAAKRRTKPPSAMPDPPGVGLKYSSMFRNIMRPMTVYQSTSVTPSPRRMRRMRRRKWNHPPASAQNSNRCLDLGGNKKRAVYEYARTQPFALTYMVRLARVERATLCLGGRCSIHLGYNRKQDRLYQTGARYASPRHGKKDAEKFPVPNIFLT